MEGQPEGMNDLLTIRIKCPRSQNLTVRDVSSLTPVRDFLQNLSTLTGIPQDEMSLLSGFPPRRILFDLTMTLGDLGIGHQDTIIAQLDTTCIPGTEPSQQPISSSSRADTIAEPAESMTTDSTLGASANSTGTDSPGPDRSSLSGTSSGSNASSRTAGSSNGSNASSRTDGSSSGSNAPSRIPVLSSVPQAETSNTRNKSSAMRPIRGQNLRQGSSFRPPVNPPDTPDVPLGSIGVMMRKVIPSDNSCLFSGITFCRTGIDNASSADLRDLIADTVLADPTKYNEGFLGRSNHEYVEWISRFDSWGGGIELAILSAHFGLVINVMDTQHLRINRFGEDQEYQECIFLIYDGIHYDALYLECYDGSRVITIFPTGDDSVYDQVMELGREANTARQYTDFKNFKMICQVCQQRFKDSAEATSHAKTTGHQEFSEVN